MESWLQSQLLGDFFLQAGFEENLGSKELSLNWGDSFFFSKIIGCSTDTLLVSSEAVSIEDLYVLLQLVKYLIIHGLLFTVGPEPYSIKI